MGAWVSYGHPLGRKGSTRDVARHPCPARNARFRGRPAAAVMAHALTDMGRVAVVRAFGAGATRPWRRAERVPSKAPGPAGPRTMPRIRVTRPDQAARVSVSRVSTLSVNVTLR